ncbi:subunit alpha of organic solute transporter [Chloropicon primus]|uniref:Subunit alpha of organic solute transporter n=1 Tax=Chloropicon primus TaxID=1764295 RepID=A0A5B8MP05_9CHLO|nr:subunit alpha of organic solute transporter [Chloropicon primus]|eukprot:QDZ22137.1 subunit alpha of organic solute transporter [Chloropicon primus]
MPWYVTRQATLLASLLACVFAILSVFIAFLHIRHHLRNYHEPVVQRYTIRIVLMVPIYAVMSCISLFFYGSIVSFIVTLVRDIYEAYTLYNFLALMLCLLGGPNVLVSKWKEDAQTTQRGENGDQGGEAVEDHDELGSQFSWWTCTCCLKDLLKIDINNPLFLRMIRQGVMQYIFVKIILAVFQIVLKCVGKYEEQLLNFESGYVYCVVVYNVSIAIALYSLVVFYLATKKYLKPYRPVLKFALVKIIIFVTFWQGLVIKTLFMFHVIEPLKGLNSGASGDFIVNFLICFECVILAGLNILGFPPGTVKKGKETNIVHSLKHFVRMNDVLMDTAHTFLPNQKYSEFVVINAHEGFQQDEEQSPSPEPTQPPEDNDLPLIAIDEPLSHESTVKAAVA